MFPLEAFSSASEASFSSSSNLIESAEQQNLHKFITPKEEHQIKALIKHGMEANREIRSLHRREKVGEEVKRCAARIKLQEMRDRKRR